MQRHPLVIVAMLLLFFAVPVAVATTIRVPLNQPTIQAGVDAASTGDTVLIAPDTYTGEGNWNIEIGTPGIVVASEAGAAATIIDCQGQGPAITVSAMGDTSTIIQGLTFTGGVGNYQYAGAIYLLRPATLRDCVFHGNQGQNGGAVKLWNGGTFLIDRCVFRSNGATNWGGAIANNWCMLLLRDSVFLDNESASDGGAVYLNGGQARIRGCTFVANSGLPSAAVGCGSMTVQEVIMTRSIVAFSTEGSGVDDEYASAEVARCCVFENEGGDDLPAASHDNLFEDPRLCSFGMGDVTLCADSPCLASSPGNPWATLIGALGQGCGECGSPVMKQSWGCVKALFRRGQ